MPNGDDPQKIIDLFTTPEIDESTRRLEEAALKVKKSHEDVADSAKKTMDARLQEALSIDRTNRQIRRHADILRRAGLSQRQISNALGISLRDLRKKTRLTARSLREFGDLSLADLRRGFRLSSKFILGAAFGAAKALEGFDVISGRAAVGMERLYGETSLTGSGLANVYRSTSSLRPEIMETIGAFKRLGLSTDEAIKTMVNFARQGISPEIAPQLARYTVGLRAFGLQLNESSNFISHMFLKAGVSAENFGSELKYIRRLQIDSELPFNLFIENMIKAHEQMRFYGLSHRAAAQIVDTFSTELKSGVVSFRDLSNLFGPARLSLNGLVGTIQLMNQRGIQVPGIPTGASFFEQIAAVTPGRFVEQEVEGERIIQPEIIGGGASPGSFLQRQAQLIESMAKDLVRGALTQRGETFEEIPQERQEQVMTGAMRVVAQQIETVFGKLPVQIMVPMIREIRKATPEELGDLQKEIADKTKDSTDFLRELLSQANRQYSASTSLFTFLKNLGEGGAWQVSGMFEKLFTDPDAAFGDTIMKLADAVENISKFFEKRSETATEVIETASTPVKTAIEIGKMSIKSQGEGLESTGRFFQSLVKDETKEAAIAATKVTEEAMKPVTLIFNIAAERLDTVMDKIKEAMANSNLFGS